METSQSRVEQSFEYLDEKHKQLIADATKFFSIAQQHSQTDYNSSLYTRDLYMNDEQVEQRIGQHLEQTRESVKQMDAALTHIDETLENTDEGLTGPNNYTQLLEKKRWYKEKYIELTEQLLEIEESPLTEKTEEWSHERPQYTVPENRFQIEVGHERKASRTTVEGDQ